MPTSFVTISGVMTWTENPTEPPKPPLGIWGPTDPRPSNPIQLPPWVGQPQPPWPTEPPQPPLGIWGPNDPRPSNPIQLPPWVGKPQPPWPPTPPGGGQVPGMPGQLPSSDPEGSGWVFAFVPGYGWMWAYVPKPPTTEPPPVTEPPSPDTVP